MKVLRTIVAKIKIDRIWSQKIREFCGIQPVMWLKRERREWHEHDEDGCWEISYNYKGHIPAGRSSSGHLERWWVYLIPGLNILNNNNNNIIIMINLLCYLFLWKNYEVCNVFVTQKNQKFKKIKTCNLQYNNGWLYGRYRTLQNKSIFRLGKTHNEDKRELPLLKNRKNKLQSSLLKQELPSCGNDKEVCCWYQLVIMLCTSKWITPTQHNWKMNNSQDRMAWIFLNDYKFH